MIGRSRKEILPKQAPPIQRHRLPHLFPTRTPTLCMDLQPLNHHEVRLRRSPHDEIVCS